MGMRVRFAPSPTGKVHIGNIRTAIFNWLLARHAGGEFLLRIEDTDRERSTAEAVEALLACMDWLGLGHDGAIFFQSAHAAEHVAAAERLLASGHAYRAGDGTGPVLFRLPWDDAGNPHVRTVGPMELATDPDTPVTISQGGIAFAQLSAKGKAVETSAALAGFRGLRILGAGGQCLFALDDEIGNLLAGKGCYTFEGCAKLAFTRREVVFRDLVKGELAKPMDTMKDQVIVRADGNPVFHLANVCDDIAQGITHIVRGDDHVENTYRHVLLFHALGAAVPLYAHLPMIVNAQGKPYSKRDGDAYVGDFRAKGYLAEALFNYLSLLGWSPGDDREKMSRAELVEAFAIERVLASPGRFDPVKLLNLNGRHIAELPPATFADLAWSEACAQGWADDVDRVHFDRVAALHQSRVKLLPDIAAWRHFFRDLPGEYDEKALRKAITGQPQVRAALAALATVFAEVDPWGEPAIEAAIHAIETLVGLAPGKLNQPLRLALTGSGVGAGIYETAALLGRERTVMRLKALPS